MKRMLWIFCALVFALSLSLNVYAHENRADDEDSGYAIETSDIEYENSPVNKLGRGALNAATCWAEIPAEVFKVSKESDPFLGSTLGVVQGTFTALVRGITGVFDVVTFIIPPYNKPLMKPEYALKSADSQMREYLW